MDEVFTMNVFNPENKNKVHKITSKKWNAFYTQTIKFKTVKDWITGNNT